MIREIFFLIKNKYKNKSQHIESLKRQMADNPEKFKQLLAEQQEQENQQPPEEPKEEEKPAEEEPGAGAEADGAEEKEKPKQKRPPVDKQVAYLEFKKELGKPIELSIL